MAVPLRTRPILLVCRSCDVAWDTVVGRACWVCGIEAEGYPRQLVISSSYSIGQAASDLTKELEGLPRDWDGDPTGYTRIPQR